MAADHRIHYLDSLRGLAALQVLILHFVTAFVPPLVLATVPTGGLAGYIHESPLFWLYDGYSAVYIFFILSGYVLTPAFSTPGARLRGLVASRIMRLLIPAVAACILSAVVKMALGSPNQRAGTMLHSGWLRNSWEPPQGVWFFMKDSLLNSLVLGYRGTSTAAALDLFNGAVDSPTVAYVSPLWSLSIEFQGSLLVLLLVWIKKYSTSMWAIVSASLFVLFLRSHFYLFVLGHVLAVFAFAERRRIPNAVAAILLVSGIALCVREEVYRLPMFTNLCGADGYFLFPCMPHGQKILGAALVFVGVIQSTQLKIFLGRRFLQPIGELSFSIYLVHWPIIFGVAAALLPTLTSAMGVSAGVAATVVVGIAVTLLAAKGFSVVDRAAITAARMVRRAL